MKITCLLGSPREQGNSSILANHFCKTAQEYGAVVRTFSLNKLQYRGCQACMACKNKLDRCILEDGLTEVLETVRESDIVVMASPIYYGEVSSQLKRVHRPYIFLSRPRLRD